eukprot:817798-Pelagomonas_calceolata.AAC.6
MLAGKGQSQDDQPDSLAEAFPIVTIVNLFSTCKRAAHSSSQYLARSKLQSNYFFTLSPTPYRTCIPIWDQASFLHSAPSGQLSQTKTHEQQKGACN